MNWAHYAILSLQQGKAATINPRGNSMKGKVESGDTVVVAPISGELEVGDIVLVKCKGNTYLHLIVAKKQEGDKVKYLIGNNRGGQNGWVSRDAIYGIATSVAGISVK